MSATATMNGKPQRKQLADQLDRLDSIIDTLADVLPSTVADACREGARAAVKDAILEIISNPELRALLMPPTPVAPMPMPAAPPAPPPSPSPGPARPSMWSRIKSKVNAPKAAVIGAVAKVKESVVNRCAAVRDAVTAAGNAVGESIPLKQISLVALGVVVGVACLVVPHATAAVIGALGAAATAIAVQTGSWLKRAACRVGLLA